jgi:lipopolysaccharide/colanic/teichoic acid biosynthesis glycosyltransferase
MGKRLFDIACAATALALLAPLLLALALWVRLDSPGPVLFRQQRVGRDSRPFAILKFRTMQVNAEAAGLQITVGQDPRITRAGSWLRRSKLDELPQLLNVLRGDMSMVGPRPEVPRYVALYPTDVRETVLSVRPGITDLASLAFRDESTLLAQSPDPERTYVEVILPTKLRYACDYVQQRSLWLDLRIIDENQLIAERRDKLRALREAQAQGHGVAFPNDFKPQHHAADLQVQHGAQDAQALEAQPITVCVAGRMMLKRVMGKASFATVQDASGRIQLYVTRDALGEELYAAFKHWDLGDILGAEGTLFAPRRASCRSRSSACGC